MSDAYKQSLSIIKKHKKIMEEMAKLLLMKEYITKQEFEEMMENPESIKKHIQAYEKEQKKLLEATKKIITNK